MYIYIYTIHIRSINCIYMCCRVTCRWPPTPCYGSPDDAPAPPSCMQFAPFLMSSLVFARYLQHFFLAATYFQGNFAAFLTFSVSYGTSERTYIVHTLPGSTHTPKQIYATHLLSMYYLYTPTTLHLLYMKYIHIPLNYIYHIYICIYI